VAAALAAAGFCLASSAASAAERCVGAKTGCYTTLSAELHGGGIFTEFPIQLSETRIRHNSPDDCAG
jgi:hypothetical protein